MFNEIKKWYLRLISIVAALSLAIPQNFAVAQANTYNGLPQPDRLVAVSKIHYPAILRGIKIDPQDPLKLELIVDTQDERDVDQKTIDRFMEYFLAALTTPEDKLWVNLSPYESDRIIPDPLAFTELGKGLLEQDYILKQFTASLTYPQSPTGKQYWGNVYKRVYDLTGTT